MIVDNYRLPPGVEEGAVNTPTFKTIVTTSDSGIESRISVRSVVIWTFQIGYGVTDSTWPAVRDCMLLSLGQGHPFAFKNWSNYQATDANLGTGDGINLTFPLIVTTDASLLTVATVNFPPLGRTFVQRIYLPEDGSLSVKVNGVTSTQLTQWTLQDDGVVQFNGGFAPPPGQAVTASFTFLTPVRWDADDAVGITLASPTGARINNAKLRQIIPIIKKPAELILLGALDYPETDDLFDHGVFETTNAIYDQLILPGSLDQFEADAQEVDQGVVGPDGLGNIYIQ